MGRNKQPIALLVAKGRSHMGKREIEERMEREIKVPFTDVEPPEYLTGEKHRAEFMEIAGKLQKIGIFTELDADVLARYILSKALYLQYTAKLPGLIRKGNTAEVVQVQRLQDTAFKQCRQCGNDLGLSITSRCKLQIPQVDDAEDYEL